MSARFPFGAALIAVAVACGSGPELEGVGTDFDVVGLTSDVSQFCDMSCHPGSTREHCRFEIRYNLLHLARQTDDPEACFEMLRAPLACLLDLRSCEDERCTPENADACQLSDPPSVSVPAAVEPAAAWCEALADCDSEWVDNEVERQRSLAFCLSKLIATTEIWLVDRGASCAQAYIDLYACYGGRSPCSVGSSNAKDPCLLERAAYDAECRNDP